MMRLDPPVLVMVAGKVVLPLTWMLPKARLAGFAATVPGVTPAAESGMLKLESEPVEVTLMLPVADPLAVGENDTENDALCPALSVTGNVSPLKLNPVPLAAAAEMVRLDPPELVKVPLSDFEVPT
jgi:hypothetical protein